ncbi:hypothetical protein [Streptomyces sp. NPDC003077]|uniref:hypothetical protein n=1 Tax=Streptomyces sp. NPDC003077 TaxID=3154443 RepID=UPI0033ADD53D
MTVTSDIGPKDSRLPKGHPAPASSVPQHFPWPDDVIATAGLYSESVLLGDEPPAAANQESTVSFYQPLVYRLDGEHPNAATGSAHVLVCLPYDLAPLGGARSYGELELVIDFGDSRVRALDVTPAPGGVQPDGTLVSVFGRGDHRVRWVFRPPSHGLRADGHWNQAYLRLPPGLTRIRCRVTCEVTVRRTILGRPMGTRARTAKETDFLIDIADAWRGAPPASGLPHPMTIPGAPADRTASKEGEEEEGDEDHQAPWMRRLFLAVDVEGYSRRHNTHMARIQRDLSRAVRAACAYASVDWHRCGRQVAGDGYLIILPPGIDEPATVARMVEGLVFALHTANSDEERPVDIGATRMRASLHQGLIQVGPSGFVGQAVVALFRILDSAELRRALKSSRTADLAVAWSDALYQDIVRHAYPGLDARSFHQAHIHLPEKNDFTATVWIELRPRPGQKPDGPQPDQHHG